MQAFETCNDTIQMNNIYVLLYLEEKKTHEHIEMLHEAFNQTLHPLKLPLLKNFNAFRIILSLNKHNWQHGGRAFEDPRLYNQQLVLN
jgi:hypothetical protein